MTPQERKSLQRQRKHQNKLDKRITILRKKFEAYKSLNNCNATIKIWRSGNELKFHVNIPNGGIKGNDKDIKGSWTMDKLKHIDFEYLINRELQLRN
jgi:hypothetical protein